MSAIKDPVPSVEPSVKPRPSRTEDFAGSSSPSFSPPPEIEISPNQALLLRIRITCDSNRELQTAVNPALLTKLQNAIVEKVEEHLGSKLLVRVNFYKGSLIIIIAITAGALVYLNRETLSYLSNDLQNVVRRSFGGLKNLATKIDFQKVKEGLGVLKDILTIGAKLLQIFFGGGLPPYPPFPDGWEPI